MKFCQVTHDGQAESETIVLTRTCTILLSKAIKNVRQKLRRNSDTRVANNYSDIIANNVGAHVYMAAVWSEFDRVGQKVPDHLLQPRRVTCDRPGTVIKLGPYLDVLCCRARPNYLDRIFYYRDNCGRLEIQQDLAGDQSRCFKQFFYKLGLSRRVA